MKTLRIVIGVLVIEVIALLVFIYSGAYPIGADDHHTKPVYALLDTLRDRSVGARSVDIHVPELKDTQMIRTGAVEYDEMCAQCHMRPGETESELSTGLYPKPPNLTHADQDEDDDDAIGPAQEFWIIKHGIKASAMPAWGLTHDDDRIWSMVAFLQKLPTLNPAEYRSILAIAKQEESANGTEHHDGHAPQAQPPGDEMQPQADGDKHPDSG
jgi:mono/diheme cytochrome c family protein